VNQERFVLDASVTLAWCFEDEANPYSWAVLDSLARCEALVPSIWPLEICNVLVVAERRGRINENDTAAFLDLIAQLPIVMEWEPADRIFGQIIGLARQEAMTSYDASYLDLCLRTGLPLATQDAALRGAAERRGVIIHLADIATEA